MGEGQGQERTQQLTDDPDRRASELRAEIEDVREDLGDTAAALAAKTDVKSRVRAKVDDLKHTATGKKDDLLSGGQGQGGTTDGIASTAGSTMKGLQAKARENPVPTAAAGALIGGFLLGRLSRRDT
jgi:hypothetical protein